MANDSARIVTTLRALVTDLQTALPVDNNNDLHHRMKCALVDIRSLEQILKLPNAEDDNWAATPFCSPQRLKSQPKVEVVVPNQQDIDAIIQDLKQRAGDSFKAKDFSTALRLCNEAVELQPEAAPHYSNRSLANLRLGFLNNAISDAQQAIRCDPSWGKAYLRLGAALQANGEFEKSANALRTSIEKDIKECGPMATRMLEEVQTSIKMLEKSKTSSANKEVTITTSSNQKKNDKEQIAKDKLMKAKLQALKEKEAKEKEIAEREAEEAILFAKKKQDQLAKTKLLEIEAQKHAALELKETEKKLLDQRKAEFEAKERERKELAEIAEKAEKAALLEKRQKEIELKEKAMKEKAAAARAREMKDQESSTNSQNNGSSSKSIDSAVKTNSNGSMKRNKPSEKVGDVASSSTQGAAEIAEPIEVNSAPLQQQSMENVSPLAEPLGIVPAIQDCLRRAARGGLQDPTQGLTEDYVAAKFKGLDQQWSIVARQLLGSAVQHADSVTGDVPAKILANMHRFITLTMRKRKEQEEAKNPPIVKKTFSDNGGASGGGQAQGVKFSASATSVEHSPTFLHSNLKSKASSDGDDDVVELVVTKLDDTSPIMVKGEPVLSRLPSTVLDSKKQSGGGKKKNKNEQNPKKEFIKDVNKRISSLATGLAASLMEKGSAVCDQFLAPGLVKSVCEEISKLEPHFKSAEIWVGKDADVGAQITVPRVRGDKVLWVDADSIANSSMEATRSMMESLDRLVLHELKMKVPNLKRVKDRSDAMLAIYPGGGSRFQRHIDNTARDGRILTVLCYLNEEWNEEDGGNLRIHPKEGELITGATDVPPACGRVAMFYADCIPHEVLPAHAMRRSVTFWYYDADERAEAIEKANNEEKEGSKSEIKSANNKCRQEARAFLLWILGTDKEATQSMVEAIAQRALKLSPEAVRIVASVVGAPSPEDFMEALARLTPDTLQKLRLDLNEMGLDKAS